MQEAHEMHEEIEACLVALVEGRLSRDAADRWAAGWVTDDTLALDELSRWALELLYGVDLPAGPDGGPLHDDAQLREWLAEFRRRRQGGAADPG
ncbi:hypothetical protein [Streptomyces cucumeris]|uniref:hypothetical protein n=1 Tax=Streptomyces cucumeris TaxID=2962890 RepID=UPI003D72808F